MSPSLSSVNDTALSSAVSVVMRSTERKPSCARKTNRVSSLQERSAPVVHPLAVTSSVASTGAARRALHPAVEDRSHVRRRAVGLIAVGVVPEVEPVHVAVVEPESGVVRMVDAFARPWIERIAARDDRAARAADRIQHRLLERRRARCTT